MKQIGLALLYFGLGLGFFYGLMYFLEYKDQTRYMNSTADCALAYAKQNRPIEFINNLNATDVWGNHMNIKYEVTKEYSKVTVTSMGRDEKPGTSDDWKLEKFDYNKSYMLGKFTGDRAKDIASGLIDGVLNKENENVD
jgi:hypothetical protein